MTVQSATTSTTPTAFDSAARDTLGLWSQAWGVDGYAFTREAMSAWACATTAWMNYLGRLATSPTPLAVFDAGSALMTDCLKICSQAASDRLKDAGLSTPLLNDA